MGAGRKASFLLFVILLAFPSMHPPVTYAQSSNRWTVTVTFENKGADSDPYFLESVTGTLEPDPAIPGSTMLKGNGTGTWQWRDPQTEQCPPYSGSGSFPAALMAIVGEAQLMGETGLSIGLQAVPGRSLAGFEDFKKHYSVTCHSPPDYVFDEDRSSTPVPLLPQVFLKNTTAGWYGEDIGLQTDCCVSKMTVTLSPPDVKYRIFGTIRDAKGHALSESKVVVGDYDVISGGARPLQMLSASEPDFEDETVAGKDDGHYEFELDRPATKPLRALVVSLLWYDGEGQLAVTNGEQVDGRYIPIYQAACVDHSDNDCAKWVQTSDGFEAQVDITYGFGSSQRHRQVMAEEHWNVGNSDMGRMVRDASLIYTNSYKAMKYFESMRDSLGNPLNPVRIDIYNSAHKNCKDEATGNQRDNAFFDYQARQPFGRLGNYLGAQDATGGTVTICTMTSSENEPDAPINREYHELGHYLQNDMYSPSSNLLSGRGTPHAGYANDGTNDSLVEGFASFVAMLVAEHYNEMEGGLPLYPLGQARKNLEQDYRVWGENARMFRLDDGRVVPYFSPDRRNDEEWAVAGLLWDLHDGGQEFHVSHMVSAGNDPNQLWAPISEVYNVTKDNVALSDYQILDDIRSAKPMNLVGLYPAFSDDVSSQDLEMIFLSHGVFGDVLKRDLVQSVGESIGPTGSSEAPVRPDRSSPQPKLNGSYISSENDGVFEIKFDHAEQYSFYDFSYELNMTKGVPAYFEMPPSYYPSTAEFVPVSPDGRLGKSMLTLNSTDYWNYIYSNPQQKAVFKTIEAMQQPAPQPDNSTAQAPSGCLIATAAFGSELAPQVQFLREFRDNRILSTASGTSFMNVFNSWYYSFSPQVADYERSQPWLQGIVRVAIYPLLGILQLAEKAYSIIPGEFGSMTAGIVASSLIGAAYFSPAAVSINRVRRIGLDYRTALSIIGAVSAAAAVSVLSGSPEAMAVSTSALVLTMIILAAVSVAKVLQKLTAR